MSKHTAPVPVQLAIAEWLNQPGVGPEEVLFGVEAFLVRVSQEPEPEPLPETEPEPAEVEARSLRMHPLRDLPRTRGLKLSRRQRESLEGLGLNPEKVQRAL